MAPRTIWKFPIPLRETVTIEMPWNAWILSAALADGELTLWALVDPKSDPGQFTFHVYATGDPCPDGMSDRFIGTVAYPDGSIWHVFQGVSMRITERAADHI